MRILHTSDWHLGRSFHRVGLLDAQARFVDHLVATVAAERVDVVVVSGDVFDRALAPVDAVALGSEALARLLAARVRVVMISGNHDSGPRLGFAAELIDSAGIHLRTDPARVGVPVVIPDDHGDVAFYGIPYLEPDVVSPAWSLAERSHRACLGEAMRRVRHDLSTKRLRPRSVVAAHAFVAGAVPSDSERDIAVGGVQMVGLDTFNGPDYAALGHLHGRQTLARGVRYSGSPLAYSFSEHAHVKGSWLVELGRSGVEGADFVEAPVPRPLAVLRGHLDDLLGDPSLGSAESAWLQVTLTDAERPRLALERLRRRFPHTLVLSFEPAVPDVAAAAPPAGPVGVRSDTEIVGEFYREVLGRSMSAEEGALVRRASEACRVAEDRAS